MPKHIVAVGLLLCFALFGGLNAQTNFWNSIDEQDIIESGERLITPVKYQTFELDFTGIDAHLGNIEYLKKQTETRISIPRPDGRFQEFRLKRNGLIPIELASRYPQVQSFDAEATDGSGAWAKIDIGPLGFHAMVKQAGEDTWFIDPYQYGENEHYLSFFRSDRQLPPGERAMECYVKNEISNKEQIDPSTGLFKSQTGDGMLRTYRLALATTAEYGNFHGGSNASTMAAVVTTMNRVNGIFETDISVTMVLVPNTDDLFNFGAAGADPYTNDDGDTLLEENVTECDNVIGSSNYDIGHVFSTGGGGVANGDSVCGDGKAGGVTGQESPIGDTFDVDYVTHEMGHQYGGNHTQNNDCNRWDSAAMEPGSGSTIMGYAGICSPNVQGNSDDHFHAHSIQEMTLNITNGLASSCAVFSTDGNSHPIVSAGSDYTIPISTPFELSAAGSDSDGDAITYCWEQMDPEVAPMPPASTNTDGPAFRSYSPITSPVRTVPNLNAIVNGFSPTWEVLSSVNRHYDWRVTVRDNNPGQGATDEDDMRVTVSDDAGPFLVVTPNTDVSWTGSSTETVTWDVAGTTNSPVSCANVDILLSLYGGFSYPIILANGVANDGSQSITVPNNATTEARVKVICSDNIFFDISDEDFSISETTVPDFELSLDNYELNVCEGASVSANVTILSILGFNSAVSLTVTGLPTGVSTSFSSATVSPTAASTLSFTVNGASSSGAYNFTITGNGGGIDHEINGTLHLAVAAPGIVSTTSPATGATVPTTTSLIWAAQADASHYSVQIATDMAMTNLVESNVPSFGTSYSPSNLQGFTSYYWTVTGVNECGNGTPSAVATFTTTAPAYCESKGGIEDFDSWIETVEITGELNNNSGSDNGYADYTAEVFNASYGQVYNLTITPGFTPDGPWNTYSRVWIDFNGDGDFYDTGELVFEQGPSTTAVSGTISIPATGPGLTTRMRVAMRLDDYPTTPCEEFDWGEVEDYTIIFPSNCPDDDNDSVCNDDDLCPGFDDLIDTDGDNLPDGCDPIAVNLTVVLEGPVSLSSGLMSTNLAATNLIPTSSPYSVAPWNLPAITASSIPSTAVDWVLIEARTGTPVSMGGAGTSVVETQVGFLLSNGTIVSDSGISLQFSNLSFQANYYFVVRHRNHLDVMTSSPLSVASGSINYDFSSALNQAFGTEQLKELTLSSGLSVFVLYGGEFNTDGVVQTTDYDMWKADPSITTAYKLTDGNLDGTVQTTDFDLWERNKAKIGSSEIAY
ncbi:M12 family metallo-peptidase [Chitinophagales bacterium]|nr:M12 family metallo-peptidase [Chitinophagales bacterium]